MVVFHENVRLWKVISKLSSKLCLAEIVLELSNWMQVLTYFGVTRNILEKVRLCIEWMVTPCQITGFEGDQSETGHV